jgi:hypothetical protein
MTSLPFLPEVRDVLRERKKEPHKELWPKAIVSRHVESSYRQGSG